MYGGSGARSGSLFRSQCETRDLLLAFGSLYILQTSLEEQETDL
jgi:hypothetical protein